MCYQHFKWLEHLFFILLLVSVCRAFEKDMTFEIEAGSKTCFFERGLAGQLLEAQYEVTDGHHGELDISFQVLDPNGTVLVSDYKKTHNSIIKEITESGDYVFCFDNTFSMINSKTVFLYLLMESGEAEEDGAPAPAEKGGEEVLEWTGLLETGQPYYVEVAKISSTLTRVLKSVAKARHQLDIYAAGKSRDSHVAFESTLVVDVWSVFQITVMLTVGAVQVYMLKQLFDRPGERLKQFP